MYQHTWESKRHSIAWKLWQLWKVMRLWNKLLWLFVISLLNWALCGHGRITSPGKIFEVNYLWSAISNRKKVILSEVWRKTSTSKFLQIGWPFIHANLLPIWINPPFFIYRRLKWRNDRWICGWNFVEKKRKIPNPEQYYQGL